MNRSARHHLLEDALVAGALAESLAATRRAARHRRVRRRAASVSALLCAVVAAGWFLRRPAEIVPDAPVVAAPPVPPFLLITTAGTLKPGIVRTSPARSALIVSTRDTAVPTPRASEDELFAFAGSRPAALHRLGDGSARWMWLDAAQPF